MWEIGSRFNIKILSYQYRNCADKTILQPFYPHSGNSYTDKVTSLYWVRATSTRKQDIDIISMKYSVVSVGRITYIPGVVIGDVYVLYEEYITFIFIIKSYNSDVVHVYYSSLLFW